MTTLLSFLCMLVNTVNVKISLHYFSLARFGSFGSSVSVCLSMGQFFFVLVCVFLCLCGFSERKIIKINATIQYNYNTLKHK